ncbi:hypothetical protein AQUCO_02300138v1 [Aquilegia coerulea]|uniref:Polygalacturonase n=1 Tax=Aquilegia coerulea TaxID=218851 RepID=A0A2G5DC66_AQUCA|nr:hypothetical protein AQUCO_02300138v1 [Aquilegia coerulea]
MFFSISRASVEYNVVQLGAKSDGKTDCTKSFQQAWTLACNSVSSATITVPSGRYLLKNIVFAGECKNTEITIRIEGTLVAPSDYNVIGESEDWIKFEDVNGVSIYGGTLDGQGTGLWACKSGSGKNCPNGATSLKFGNSKNIAVQGLSSINSQKFHIHISDCENVKVQGVTITASGNSPNTDGIHVASSTAVTIMKANIKTGDDCISIGPGTTNLWIENIACGPGHGISIGSLGQELNEQGVQNVTVKTVSFTGTENGFRIKTWPRPSNGFVKNILFQDGTMNNAENPIIINQNYCPGDENCSNQVSGVAISQVTYKGIHGTSSTQVAVNFDCSTKKPCSGIILEEVDLTYQNKAAQSSCTSADGSAYGVVQPSSCL